MPRAGQVKPPTDRRLSDHISIGVLTRVYPPEVVDEVIEAAGRGEQRHRVMPARVTAYYVLALALFSGASYEEAMRFLVDGLAWQEGWRHQWQVPTKAAMFKARQRLGAEPLQGLYEATAKPLATADTEGAWLGGWRLVSIDGTCLDVPDTAVNDAAFGRPGSSRGERRSAFPQLRLVGLCESGTHAIYEAAMGAYTTSERELAGRLVGRLEPGMLCLADRGFYSFRLWQQAAATGAELLWRMPDTVRLDVEQRLADGSYLSRIYDRADRRRRGEGVPVRVIAYELDDPGRGGNERYRLATTILDPDAAAAVDLAGCYPERWELESALGELKTYQRGSRVVLRSKDPDGVYQEAYAHLAVHYAIRALMHQAALTAKLDPDRLSFLRSLRVARRTTGSHPGFSP